SDPGDPLVTPVPQLLMGVAGADEVPADVGPAPQRVNAFHAGQGLVGGVEICREQQAPAFGERPVGAVDAEVAFQDGGGAGGVHPEHDRVAGDEHPQPPPVAVLALYLLEHPPAGLIRMHVHRLGVTRADRVIKRDQQVRDRFQRAAYGALGHVQAVGGQRSRDPVHRQAQHVLLVQQPGQEPRGEPPLGHRVRCWRRDHRPRPRALAAPPVPQPAVHDPGDPHLPVDLLTALRPEELERLPALRAGSLPVRHVVDLLTGLQPGVVPPAMALAARPLAPPASLPATTRLAGIPRAVITSPVPGLPGASLLRGLAEQHPRQHRDLLSQLQDPRLRTRQALFRHGQTALGQHGPLTPVRHISDVINHSPGRHADKNTPATALPPRTTPNRVAQTPNPGRRNRPDQTAPDRPHGITEFLPRIITEITPLIEKATAEFRPTADEARAVARGQTVLVDGFLAPCWSWRGAPGLWSGKHKTTGFNGQVISNLAGDVIFVSEPITGHNHDMTALSETETAEVIAAAFSAIGDKGYQV